LKKLFFIVFIALCFSFFSYALDTPLPKANPESVGFSSERLNKIDTVFNKGINENKIPGAVIAIARKGKLVYFKAFGMQNVEEGIPMSTDSIFRIYSMTKPLVSISAMQLYEDGKLYLSEPVSKYLPELATMKVAKDNNNTLEITDAKRTIKIHDLLRHTSGFTYGIFGKSAAKKLLKESDIGTLDTMHISLEDYVSTISKLPLAYQPGTHWEYGRSIEVLGRLVEVISENSLDYFMKKYLFEPLNMKDTDFYVTEENWSRIAEPLKNNDEPELIDIKNKPRLLTGGHGLASTAGDYIRFIQMMLNKGILDGRRILGTQTVDYITADHLGKDISRAGPLYLPGSGYGFGLGFAVRENDGVSAWPGSVGEYFWGGYAGTYFWVDPKEDLVVVSMTQSVKHRVYYRMLLRNLVYQAIID
jgi:CubicO group peptidase (beta-lactamase class C family)